MAAHHHMNNTLSMHHGMNNSNTHPFHIPKAIVEKHGTESVLLLELHSPESADLFCLAVPFRRNFAEIRPYSRWRIYVSRY
jgi:hypothetical protein